MVKIKSSLVHFLWEIHVNHFPLEVFFREDMLWRPSYAKGYIFVRLDLHPLSSKYQGGILIIRRAWLT